MKRLDNKCAHHTHTHTHTHIYIYEYMYIKEQLKTVSADNILSYTNGYAMPHYTLRTHTHTYIYIYIYI